MRVMAGVMSSASFEGFEAFGNLYAFSKGSDVSSAISFAVVMVEAIVSLWCEVRMLCVSGRTGVMFKLMFRWNRNQCYSLGAVSDPQVL